MVSRFASAASGTVVRSLGASRERLQTGASALARHARSGARAGRRPRGRGGASLVRDCGLRPGDLRRAPRLLAPGGGSAGPSWTAGPGGKARGRMAAVLSGRAPPRERVRAARLEAVSLSRAGNHDDALRLLDVAEREGATGDVEFRLETALARAGVYSAAGRFAEEKEIYDQWRPAVLGEGDDLLTARLLAREALGLSDRRDFPLAVVRLEQALAVTRDDALSRAQLLMDLAATLYHAGRGGSCHALLDEAIELSSALGRQDLLRGARANRLELWINEGRWEEASLEIETTLRKAAEQGDEIWRIVALHQRSRMALRRGFLEDASRDNAEARSIIARVGDRLEVGELWLEEGDRLLYTGDVEAARRAYEVAAADPPDRCDSDRACARSPRGDRRRRTGRVAGSGGEPPELDSQKTNMEPPRRWPEPTFSEMDAATIRTRFARAPNPCCALGAVPGSPTVSSVIALRRWTSGASRRDSGSSAPRRRRS